MSAALERVMRVIGDLRHELSSEAVVQESIERALQNAGLEYEREAVLGPGNRVDFLVLGIAVEIKRKASARLIWRQLCRYAGSERVDAVLLVTGRAIRFPAQEISGKPVLSLSLGARWL